jgi:hypothetical protein
MDTICWIDRVRNEELFHRVKEEGDVLQTIKRRKANWIGHILRRNCLLKQAFEEKIKEKIEVKEKQRKKSRAATC